MFTRCTHIQGTHGFAVCTFGDVSKGGATVGMQEAVCIGCVFLPRAEMVLALLQGPTLIHTRSLTVVRLMNAVMSAI